MFDILNFKEEIPSTRQPMKFRYITQKNKLNIPLQLQDKDSSENFFQIGLKKTKGNEQFVRETQFHSMGFQVIKGKSEKSTNTEYYIQQNQLNQTDPSFPNLPLDQKTESRLLNFMKEIFLTFEEALIDNEIIQVYKNDLNVGDNETENKEESTELSIIKELKSFEYENCNQKSISKIEFNLSQNLMAVSLVENLSHEERIDIQGSSYDSYILLWNYEDFHRFTPFAILESPLEFTTFQFKPDNPLYLVAGTLNGQVSLYDLRSLNNKTFQDVVQSESNKFTKEMKDIFYFKPVLSSAIVESFNANQNLVSKEIYSRKPFHLSSHRAPIQELLFLPEGVVLDKKNPTTVLISTEDIPLEHSRDQFVTLSADGQLLFWSLDFNDIKEKTRIKLEDTIFDKISWKALLSVQLFTDDLKPLSTNTFLFIQKKLSTTLFVANMNGSLLEVEFDMKKNQAEDQNKVELVKNSWKIYNEQIIINIDISKFIPDLILVVSDTCFYLIQRDFQFPIFVSPFLQNAKFTCGKFSISRPSVIYIGRDDGFLDIWDFADQTGIPSQQHLVSATGIDFIQVNQNKVHLLAVGDKDSCIHLLNLPKSLFKNLKEENLMKVFVEKENKKILYYENKFKQFQKKKEEQEKENQDKEKNFDQIKEINVEIDQKDLQNLEEVYSLFINSHFSAENIQKNDSKNDQFIIQIIQNFL